MAGLLVYDGDCGFCTRCASLAARILPASVTITPWQHLPDLGATGLTEADVADASWWISDDCGPRGGAAGIAAALREAKQPWAWLGALMDAPGLRGAAAAAYRWTARNRYRLPGGTPACALPATAPETPARGPGRAAKLLTVVLLVAVVGAAATSTEAWPLTGWKLFSGTRSGTQAGFEVVAVHGESESPPPWSRFGRAERGQLHLLQKFRRGRAHAARRCARPARTPPPTPSPCSWPTARGWPQPARPRSSPSSWASYSSSCRRAVSAPGSPGRQPRSMWVRG